MFEKVIGKSFGMDFFVSPKLFGGDLFGLKPGLCNRICHEG